MVRDDNFVEVGSRLQILDLGLNSCYCYFSFYLQRLNLEKSQRTMEINLRDLESFNETNAPVLYCDNNEICQYGNTAFFDWYGKKPNDILGKLDLRTLLGHANYQNNQSHIQNAFLGIKQGIEMVLSVIGAGSREVLLTLLPYKVNNQLAGFFLHFTDFTEIEETNKRKLSFDEPNEGIFLKFIHNSPLPAWIVDAKGIVHFINDAFKKVKPKIILGKSFLDLLPADVANDYQKTNLEILSSRKTIMHTEKVNDPILGERVFKSVKFPIQYKNKSMVAGFAMDITEEVSAVKSPNGLVL